MRWILFATLCALALVACEKKDASAPEKAPTAEGAAAEPTVEVTAREELPPLKIEVKPQRLALGSAFTCYLNPKNELWCWGWGEQFPVPGPAEPLPPTKQDIGVELVSIDAQHRRLCGLDKEGDVHCFGEPIYANLRDPGLGASPTSLSKASSVFLGAGAVCIVTKVGSIECIGSQNDSVLGGNVYTAKPFVVAPPRAEQWLLGSGGQRHLCSISDAGTVWCWGDNEYGQLGIGTTESEQEPKKVFLDGRATYLDTDGMTTCSVDEAGEAWCWGVGDLGSLGSPAARVCEDSSCALEPLRVAIAEKAQAISPGAFHGCSLGLSGHPTCWGAGKDGQLGTGAAPKESPPRSLDLEAVRLKCSGFRCCALNREDEVYCWGANETRATAPFDAQTLSTPTQVTFGGEND